MNISFLFVFVKLCFKNIKTLLYDDDEDRILNCRIYALC